MGYTHDTQMSQFIPPGLIQKTLGTWTPTIASGLACDVRTGAGAAFTLLIPALVPSNAAGFKGARLKSIDVFYKIATADLTSVTTVELDKVTLPPPAAATGTAFTGAAVTQTQDAFHNTSALRLAQGSHTMTVTITTPAWSDDNDAYILQMVCVDPGTAVFTLYGARANYDLRV
jgi:hypothetical protein